VIIGYCSSFMVHGSPFIVYRFFSFFFFNCLSKYLNSSANPPSPLIVF